MNGRIVAVTGVASGIGAATARLLAARGANVVGLDRNVPAVPLAAFHRVDLGDPASIEDTVAAIDGPLDALINSAGLPPTASKHAVLRVNFFGLRHLTEALAPRLTEGAAIVNLASLAGFQWRANIATMRDGLSTRFADADAWIDRQDVDGAPSYHLSKELVIAWTMWESQRWKDRGIRMNSVSPGPVATPILADFVATLGKRVEDDLKINRAATADEIAPVVAFMVSPDTRWMNGADIAVDAGASAAAWREILG